MRRGIAIPILAFALFASGAKAQWARAVERTRAGDDAAALEAIRIASAAERDSPGGRVLEARLLERLEMLELARARLSSVEIGTIPESLRPDHLERLARLEASSGHFADARARALALASAENGARGARAKALAAECALALLDYEHAAEEFSALLSARSNALDSTSLSRNLARALVGLGKRTEAASTLRAAIIASPEHPDAPALRAELESLDESSARFSFRERLSLARALTSARSFDRALAELDLARPDSDSERAELAHARGSTLFSKRDYRASITAFDEAIRLHASTAVDDAYSAARAANRLSDEPLARARYEAFLRSNPNDGRRDEARLVLANLALEHGDRGPMAELSRSTRIGRATRAKAAFALALSLLANGKKREAADALAIACPVLRSEAEQLACRYFGALANRNEDAKAAALLSLATEQDHAYFGLLARKRIGRTASSTVTRVAITAAPGPLPEAVSFLHSIGLDSEAAEALAANERDEAFSGTEGKKRLAALYLELGDAGRSYRVARSLSSARDVPRSFLLSAQYPEVLAREVVPLARAVGVDPFYVYGTMRQESAYRADAVSRVGAMGILQMMPATASRAAVRAGVVDFEPTHLFQPTTSVRLALTEMSHLEARYRGCLPLVAAAYNAGTAKVDSWLETRGTWPIDLFLQAIPFDETRGYVRRVIGHTALYHSLAGAPEHGPTIFDSCTPTMAGIR